MSNIYTLDGELTISQVINVMDNCIRGNDFKGASASSKKWALHNFEVTCIYIQHRTIALQSVNIMRFSQFIYNQFCEIFHLLSRFLGNGKLVQKKI